MRSSGSSQGVLLSLTVVKMKFNKYLFNPFRSYVQPYFAAILQYMPPKINFFVFLYVNSVMFSYCYDRNMMCAYVV